MDSRLAAAAEIETNGIMDVSSSTDGPRETIGQWAEQYRSVLALVDRETLFYDERAFDELARARQKPCLNA